MTQTTPEAIAEGALIEALYVHAIQPKGRFREELLAIGLDVDRIQPRYPAQVWVRAAYIARRHVFAGESDAVALRSLGRLTMKGFFSTLTGKMLSATLSFVSARGFITRIPRFMKMGRPDVQVSVSWKGEREALLVMSDEARFPAECNSGILEEVLDRIGVVPRIKVVRELGGISELSVEW